MAKPKISTILFILSIVFLLIIVAAVSNAYNQEKTTREAKEQELAKVQSERDDLEQELDKTKAEKKEVEDKLAAMDEEVKTLTSGLDKEKKLRISLVDEVNARKKDIDNLKKELDKTKKEKGTFMAELVKIKQDYESNQDLLAQVRSAKEALEEKVKDLVAKREVQLEKIEVKAGPVSGEVLAINKEYNFVVISKGAKDGISVGRVFEVMRNSKTIGKVEVEKVYDEMSAATIVSEPKDKPIKKGDAVKSI